MIRFSARNPCPVCGGWDRLPRRNGKRCHGFLSDCGQYAHCAREERAGKLLINPNSATYAHSLTGECGCGTGHGDASAQHGTCRADLAPIAATYDYRDADGKLLFQNVRFEPKSFKQRRPDGVDGWIWNLKGTKRVLYCLPEVLSANPAETIFIVEGERDADSLAKLGLLATTNAMGAGKWRSEYSEFLRGRSVVLLPDNDDPGRDHMLKVARSLVGIASAMKILELPDLAPKGDVSDWLAAGGTPEALKNLVANLQEYKPGVEAKTAGNPRITTEVRAQSAGNAKDANLSAKESQVDRLLRLGADAELFHEPNGEPYATFPVKGHRETWRTKDRAFRHWLVHSFFRETGRGPNAQPLRDAIEVFECKARYDGQEQQVHIRVAGEDDDIIYLDLANETWQVVEVKEGGWRIISDPPVRFRRPEGMLALPIPQAGGKVQELLRFINVADQSDGRLVIAWMHANFRPKGPYPILAFHGEHGSAKTTTQEVLRHLIDPNVAPLRAEPKDQRDLAIAAGNAWIVGLDNLSYIKPWLSDSLCRLATGGGFGTRGLWTDDSERLFYSQRPIMLNGIEELASRPDLLDRSIVLYLLPIPEGQRKTKSEFLAEFKLAHPRLLGAFLDIAAAALKNLKTVRMDHYANGRFRALGCGCRGRDWMDEA